MEAERVAATSVHYTGSVIVMTKLLTRLEQVKAARGIRSWDAWAIDAGLSPGYLRSLTTRLRKSEPHGATHETFRRLAAAAAVSLTWLEDGVGDMDADGPPAPTLALAAPAAQPAHAEPPADLADAAVLAFNAERHDPADLRTLLDMLRDGRAMHRPQNPVATMCGLLDSIHSARADGAPLSWVEIALRSHPGGRAAAEARSEELNNDGDKLLAALERRKS